MANREIDRPLASYIDHTLLKPEAGSADIERLCREAVEYGFYSVCVNSQWVPLCRERLAGTDVKVCAVVGFPLGAMLPEAKAAEARLAAARGAQEIDMVLAVGWLREGRFDDVEADIRGVVQAAGSARVKVILETGLLDDALKRKACELSERAGAAFVKTSTGFGPGGATVEDVRLMRASVSAAVGVKASGGVRDAETAIRMIEAGAARIGTSSGVAIVRGQAGTGGY